MRYVFGLKPDNTIPVGSDRNSATISVTYDGLQYICRNQPRSFWNVRRRLFYCNTVVTV